VRGEHLVEGHLGRVEEAIAALGDEAEREVALRAGGPRRAHAVDRLDVRDGDGPRDRVDDPPHTGVSFALT
jgi:hypothetical protein